MRLAILSNPNSIHTQRWVRFFVARGHEVILLGPNPLTTTLPAGVTFHDLTRVTNRRKLRFVVWSWTLRRLLRAIRPDVLHAHQVTGAGWLAAASGFHPLLVTSWGSDLLVSAQRSALQRRLAQAVLRRADYVTCVSEPLAEIARGLGIPTAKVEVVHWGVDTDIFHPPAWLGQSPTTADDAMLSGSRRDLLSVGMASEASGIGDASPQTAQHDRSEWRAARTGFDTAAAQPTQPTGDASPQTAQHDRSEWRAARTGFDTAATQPTQPTEAAATCHLPPATCNLPPAPRRPLVLSIRAVRAIYNPLVIAAAIPRVLAERPDARFAIRTYSVDAALLAEFQRMVAAANAEHAVSYIGELPDDAAIAELYRQAAVVVSVPSSDGTPQSVLEAMACGAAPVLSDLPSLHAWVQPEVEGLYAPVGDAQATAAAILHLLNDDALRGRIQAAGMEMVRTRADSRVWLERYEQLYQTLAN